MCDLCLLHCSRSVVSVTADSTNQSRVRGSLPDNIPGRCFHTHEAEYIQDLNLKSVDIDQLTATCDKHSLECAMIKDILKVGMASLSVVVLKIFKI